MAAGNLLLVPEEDECLRFVSGGAAGGADAQVRAHFAAALLAENPSQPIDQDAALPAMLSAIRGAFTLAARR